MTAPERLAGSTGSTGAPRAAAQASPPGGDSPPARGSVALHGRTDHRTHHRVGHLLVATHLLSPSEFGRYSIVAALVLLVQIISDSGNNDRDHEAPEPPPRRQRRPARRNRADERRARARRLHAGHGVRAADAPVTTTDMAIAGLALPFDTLLTSVIGALTPAGAWWSGRGSPRHARRCRQVAGAVAILLGAGVARPDHRDRGGSVPRAPRDAAARSSVADLVEPSSGRRRAEPAPPPAGPPVRDRRRHQRLHPAFRRGPRLAAHDPERDRALKRGKRHARSKVWRISAPSSARR